MERERVVEFQAMVRSPAPPRKLRGTSQLKIVVRQLQENDEHLLIELVSDGD